MNRFSLSVEGVALRRGTFRLDVTADFPAGDLTVILGPSGSGKTTLLDVLAGFLIPDAGKVREGGREVANLPPYRREVGVVFQHLALFPHLNVLRNVTYGLRARGRGDGADRRAREILALVGLEGFERRAPDTLSGGERQRVALARALAIDPSVLLLDEPLSSLDTALRRRLGGEVRRIQAATGVTTLLVTHDQEEALALADRLAIMNDGRIVQTGTPREVWDRPGTLFAARFLGRIGVYPVLDVVREAGGPPFARTAAGKIDLGGVSIPPSSPGREKGTVVIRPENLRILAGEERSGEYGGTPSVVRGTVVSAVYAGGSWRVGLEAGQGSGISRIEADMEGAATPQIGDVVSWAIRPGSVRWLPEDAGRDGKD